MTVRPPVVSLEIRTDDLTTDESFEWFQSLLMAIEEQDLDNVSRSPLISEFTDPVLVVYRDSYVFDDQGLRV